MRSEGRLARPGPVQRGLAWQSLVWRCRKYSPDYAISLQNESENDSNENDLALEPLATEK
jgi:hypothetical protein